MAVLRSIVSHHRPHVSDAEAQAIARSVFGVSGTASCLPSDRDQNVLLTTTDGEAFVLKIAHAAEDRRVLETQNAVMQYLADRGFAVPRILPTATGASIAEIDGSESTNEAGRRHFVRLLTYLPGVPLASVNPHSPALLRSLGRFLGALQAALAGFDHDGAHRHLPWDVQHAPDTIRTRLPALDDPARRHLIGDYLQRFEADVVPRLDGLRRGIIHGDANDYNVLVNPPATPERYVTGLIDFGDVTRSWTVAEVAVAAAYAMLDTSDPLAAAGHVVAGFHKAFPLTEPELEVLYGLITMRLGISVCMAAVQQAREPDNAYLTVSERPAWVLLERLAGIHPRMATYRFRHACGLEPFPDAARLKNWIAQHAGNVAPVVSPDPRTVPVALFDFSVGSTDWTTEDLTLPMHAADAITERLHRVGTSIGVGRYGEARLVYTAEQFAAGEERRTIHLGIDFFQKAGSPVFAPLDGVVHSFRDNALRLDYGPTIILRHAPTDGNGSVFYTLYGHLSRVSLEGLHVGQPIRKGEQIATLGTSDENGGWAPHLHFQLIGDMLGLEGDFPGVAPASAQSVWRSLCPDPSRLAGLPPDTLPESSRAKTDLLEARSRLIGPNLSLSYREPLHIVRGIGPYLYDTDGRAYLDGVNNVAHVGHAHPRVVAAARKQMAVLNTNTRYLHENLIAYAERLTATLPEPLRVCFFVNSGSEANDLALRLAEAYTGRRGVIVLDGAYHGHLSSLIPISPYKFDGPGGRGRPPHTYVAPMPDPYRGRYRADDPDAGAKYAAAVRDAINETGGQVAAFIAESLLSCGGQIVLPNGFLREAYRHVRAAGGVCIADEVQVGFGRIGSHFWGFETQGVVPDVVTMGKPIGNGHPLAAVVTTPEIAASFASGMEYFNTYGGNPVSCAVGLAVLEVIEDEGLQAHALAVGDHVVEALTRLQERHPIIGDVRGRGLFLGIELVRDRTTLAPAAEAAAYVVNRMRNAGILLSTDGPLHNVIKLKPPLCFSTADADRLAQHLDRVLTEDFVRYQSPETA